MSFSIDYVVDLEASLDEAPSLAQNVVNSLIRRGIILSTPQVYPDLSEGPRYATGPNVDQVADCTGRFKCGLDIRIGRTLYTAGENGLNALQCPHCDHRHSPDELDWASAVGEWCEQSGLGSLSCQSCGQAASIASWRIDPVWGFGNLGFEFSEWLLKEEFVTRLSEVLGHRVAWVQSNW